MLMYDDKNEIKTHERRRIYILFSTRDKRKHGREQHHMNGPTLISNDGFKEYRVNDMLHNENGCARVYIYGRKVYSLYGTNLNERGFIVISGYLKKFRRFQRLVGLI